MWIKVLYGYQTTVIQVPTWWTTQIIDDYCKANFKQFMNWYGGKDKEDAERYEFDMNKYGYKPEQTIGQLYNKLTETNKDYLNQVGINSQTGDIVGTIDPVKWCEANQPEMCDEFKRQQKKHYELLCKKQMDYGPTNISLGTLLKSEKEIKASLTGIIIRANDKLQRLLNLVVVEQRDPNNESVEDTLDDLAVYSTIAKCVKNGKWGR